MSDDVVAAAPTNRTTIGLRADMTIDAEPVAVEGKIGESFFLQLSRPASLGTPVSFAYWLRDTYDVQNLGVMLPAEKWPDAASFKAAYKQYKASTDPAVRTEFDEAITTHLKDQVPGPLVQLLKSALLAEVTITDLLIDIDAGDEKQNREASKKMMFGLSVGFPSPLQLIPNIEFNKLSLVVMNAPEGYTFPKRVELPPAAPLPVEPRKACGHIAFSAQPAKDSTITLGEQAWTFVNGTATGAQLSLGATLEETLTGMARILNDQTAGAAASCSYRANVDDAKLEVTFREDGFAGNAFAIAAGAGSNGTASATTLSGGFGDAPRQIEDAVAAKKATGRITFDALPAEGDTIVLNGVEWGFSKAEPAADEKKSRLAGNVAPTIAALAKALNASDDAQIAKCVYAANGKALVITCKEAGKAGNAFTIATAGGDTKGQASGATLAGG